MVKCVVVSSINGSKGDTALTATRDRFGLANETNYPDREVAKIVRFVMRELEVEDQRCFVKVKYLTGFSAYAGRFYPHGSQHVRYVRDSWGDYREVAPSVPDGYRSLIVCRIRKGGYPMGSNTYTRKQGPEPWRVETWQEALVSITAHEAMHLRQWTKGRKAAKRNGGRFNEVETEWAAFRLWRRWKEGK